MSLKISDVLPSLREETLTEIKSLSTSLNELSSRYHNMVDFYDPVELEEIKRLFNGYMQRYASLYSKIRKYKGSQHVYLEDQRKQVKAEVMDRLLKTMKVSQADVFIYGDSEYVTKTELLMTLRGVMIKIELMYDRYDVTYSSIVQSQSLAKREYEQNKR